MTMLSAPLPHLQFVGWVGVWEKEGKTMAKVEIISNETCCNPLRLHPHQELFGEVYFVRYFY